MRDYRDHPHIDDAFLERRAKQRRWHLALVDAAPGARREVDLPDAAKAPHPEVAERLLRGWIDEAVDELDLSSTVEQMVDVFEARIGFAIADNSSLFWTGRGGSDVQDALTRDRLDDLKLAMRPPQMNDQLVGNLADLLHALDMAETLAVLTDEAVSE